MARSYRITESNFVRASRHAQRRLRWLLVAAMLLVLALFPALDGFSAESVTASLVVAVALLFFLWLLLPPIHRWSLGRVYRNNPLLQREQEIDMQPTGFVLRSSNGESRYQFSELKRVELLDDLVLVYPATTLFHMIPVVLLSDFELAQFRALS